MAACSSGKSSPLVLRITHDELVAYADELDKKKEKKHSKKKIQEKAKEKDAKSAKQVDKNESTDVSVSNSLQNQNERKEDSEFKESKPTEHQKRKGTAEKDHAKKRNLSGSKPKRKSSTSKEDNKVNINDNEVVAVDNKGSKVKAKQRNGSSSVQQSEHNNDEAVCEDYELELRARTGGVLKLSKATDEVVEGHSESCSQPRGIIKLPQGFDFNDKLEEKDFFHHSESAKKRTLSEGSRGRLFDADDYHSPIVQRQDVQSSDRNKESALYPSETTTANENFTGEEKLKTPDSHSENYSEYQNAENTSKESETSSVSHTKVEKKIKSLHLQKAQRLLKMVSQKESSLNNLLSRDILDKAAFEKVNSLSKEIQDAYKGIMMLDLSFAVQQEVDQNLWRNGFYKIIETLRKYGKLFLGYAEKTEVLSSEEINNCLKEFLANAETFYKNLLDLLQKNHEFSVQDVVSQPRKAEKLGKKVSVFLAGFFFSEWMHYIPLSLREILLWRTSFDFQQESICDRSLAGQVCITSKWSLKTRQSVIV